MIDVAEVKVLSDKDEVNDLLVEDWVLLEAGIDANGFPLFILGKRKPCEKCHGSGQTLVTSTEAGKVGWHYAKCPNCQN